MQSDMVTFKLIAFQSHLVQFVASLCSVQECNLSTDQGCSKTQNLGGGHLPSLPDTSYEATSNHFIVVRLFFEQIAQPIRALFGSVRLLVFGYFHPI